MTVFSLHAWQLFELLPNYQAHTNHFRFYGNKATRNITLLI